MKHSALLLLLSILLSSTKSISQIQHLEPPNWWAGMKNQNLQLLVHGNDIGETVAFINYPGVTVIKSNKADSKNYLFVDLKIDTKAKPGTFNIDFKKDNQIAFTYSYTLLPRQPGAANIQGFNSSDVIYLIMPDRFANGDPSNDVAATMRENKIDRSFPGGRHGGDLRGIINSLDYLSYMGFTAIWSTPLLENDMEAYSYHGYSITNHYRVDPRYGTLDEYKDLTQKAKQKGIKIIFDAVLNHTGSNYWWMDDLPFKDWLNKTPEYQSSNHRRTVNQDLYASDYDKNLMTKGWFDTTMPDMNGQNPFMEKYLIQNSIWWIETLQLGGIRQDTYGYSNKTLLKNWTCLIMDEYPNFNIVGEEWSTNPLVTSYWQQGKPKHDGYEGCLKTVMDFPMQEALSEAMNAQEGVEFEKGLASLYKTLANDFVYANPKNILVMGDNHDMDRIFFQLKGDVELTKMALTYLLTIRGIPQLLYGTEILMQNFGHPNDHGVIRTDFPGGWSNDVINAFTGTGLTNEQKEMQSLLKQLLNWRKKNDVIANGQTLHFAPSQGVYVYFRYQADEIIMVVMNKNNSDTTIDTKRFSEILKSKTNGENIITGEKFSIQPSLRVKRKSATVIRIK